MHVNVAMQTLIHTHEMPGTERGVGENGTLYTLRLLLLG